MFALATLAPQVAIASSNVAIAVVHGTEWSPGDAAREGAGEFLVLLQAAKLQRSARASGLLAVGDHNGMLRSGGERALRRLALTGIVVARIARGGSVGSTSDNLFVDAHSLDEAAARRVLSRALEIYGPSPVATNPEQPTERELAAIRGHLRNIQLLFATEARQQVASR